MNMRKPLVLGSLIAAVAITVTSGILATAPPEKGDQRLIALEKERLAAAKAMHAVRLAHYEAAASGLEQLVESSAEIMKARLPLALTSKERLAAYKEHLAWLRKDEQRIAAVNQVAAKGGEEDTLHRARIERLNVEIAIERERLGDAKPADHGE